MFSVKNCTIVIKLPTVGESVNHVQLGTLFAGQLRTKTKTTNEYLFTIMRFEVCMLLVKQRCFFSRCCDLEKGNARSYQEESETE